MGSSPREWGPVRAWPSSSARCGLIPTRVGDRGVSSTEAGGPPGSSPREWGPALDGRVGDHDAGLIPTRVGTGGASAGSRSPARAHPHASGDWRFDPETGGLEVGSSPREWELGPGPQGQPAAVRLIPTRVGTGTGLLGGPDGCRAHPHASGDWISARPFGQSSTGSSPREWGLDAGVRARRAVGGLIPTRVGTGRHRRGSACNGWAHPHASGDWPEVFLREEPDAGSSPREWGLGPRRQRRPRRPGLIPTRVGTGAPISAVTSWGRAHPHASGDWANKALASAPPPGSSPREWGLAAPAAAEARPLRLIPTRVGTGGAGGRCHPGRQAHPHASGDWPREGADGSRYRGSSPREWGLGERERADRPPAGLIPTRVGTGCCSAARGSGSWAHPHASGGTGCPGSPTPRRSRAHPHASGDWAVARDAEAPSGGSSPREWGLDLVVVARGARHGLIPTRVGTGRRPGSRRSPARAHPHASGDWRSACVVTVLDPGSSPREWGLVRVRDGVELLVGLIPTRVGTGRPRWVPWPWPRAHPHASGDWGGRGRNRVRARGLIPTRVGTGARRQGQQITRRAHPHASGDWRTPSQTRYNRPGSSPREWGLARGRAEPSPCLGLIPTRVGAGPPISAASSSTRAHPHASGDWAAPIVSAAQTVGSSPREWGLRPEAPAPLPGVGLIPTRVGTG